MKVFAALNEYYHMLLLPILIYMFEWNVMLWWITCCLRYPVKVNGIFIFSHHAWWIQRFFDGLFAVDINLTAKPNSEDDIFDIFLQFKDDDIWFKYNILIDSTHHELSSHIFFWIFLNIFQEICLITRKLRGFNYHLSRIYIDIWH